ncbi:MAG: hypothetical protein ABH883_02115, partial [Candidatus Omnitrophota bacterium]
MKKAFIDTSGWVALFVEKDIKHKETVEIFDQLKKDKVSIYTSDYVVDETITTIMVRGGHDKSVIAGNVLF